MTPGPYATDTIYSLLHRDDTRPGGWRTWLVLAALGVPAWIGSVTFLGQYRPNQVSGVFTSVAGHMTWFWLSVGALLAIAGIAWWRGQRQVARSALVVVAFLLGNLVYRVVVPLIPTDFDIPFRGGHDLLGFVALRAAWGLSLCAAMLLVWRVAFGGFGELALGAGTLSAAGRDTSAKRPPLPWVRQFLGGYGLFVIIMLVVLQGSVQFQPVRTGALWPALPGVLAAAVVNATSEEYVFRGLLMPAFMKAGGVGAGLWVQGAVFGLMHWGMSVGVLAALPVSLGIGFGSVLWGKAALDTRGMLWVCLAHAMIDVAVMAAYFV